MQNSDLSIFRDSVDGKQKYCRILIRRKRASVEQAIELFGQSIQELDEIAAEAGDEDKAEIRAIQACCVTAMDALRAQQERENPKPMTNADRIRAMSDEELAKMMTFGAGAFDCGVCREPANEECDLNCEERCLEWLRMPVEEG